MKNSESIGWSDFSKDSYSKEIQKNGRAAMSQICQFEWKELPRNRFNLSRFVHEMKPGDIVVVPLWKSFTVCEILDDSIYTTYIPASIHNEAMLSGAWTSIAQ